MKKRRPFIVAFIWLFFGIASSKAQDWEQIIKVLADESSRSGVSSSARAERTKAGESVAISGNYAVVGLPSESRDFAGISISNAGAALVFKLESGTWRPIKKLTASGTNARRSDDAFGTSVAISGDYIAVGAPNNSFDSRGEAEVFQAGAVFVFKKDQGGSDNWGQLARLTPSGLNNRNTSDGFGSSVALSGDYLIVGSPNNAYDATGGGFSSRAGAAFVFKKDQGGTDSWGQLKKIVASDRQSNDRFGVSVAVSGQIAIVGAPGHSLDENGENSLTGAGAVYLFSQNRGGTDAWGQLAKTVATGRAASNAFGSSVAIDGNYAAVGSPFQKTDATGGNSLNDAGAAYVLFKDQGGTNLWGVQAMLIPSDPNARNENDEFGNSVAISGNFAFVGSAKNDFNSTGASSLSNSGIAFVYKKDQGGTNNWGQLRRIGTTQTRSASDLYGRAIAASGNNLLVGMPGFKFNAQNALSLDQAGAVCLHTVNQGGAENWGQAQLLLPGSLATQDNFGFSVSVSGNYAVVGAPNEDEDAAGSTVENSGAAYIFKRSGSQWSFLKKITPSLRGINDAFGSAVALSGEWLAVGAPKRSPNTNLNQAGTVFLFRVSQGGADNWGQVKVITPTGTNAHQAGDEFGSSVALSGDLMIVGAPKHDFDANGANAVNDFGAAYIFEKNQGGDNNWGQVKKLIPSAGGSRAAQDNFGTSVHIGGQYAIVGAPNVASNATGGQPVIGAGAAFIFKKDIGGLNNWGQVRKIVAFGTENARNSGDKFGSSVAIEGSYALVGAPFHGFDASGENQLEESGAAYVFKASTGGNDAWGGLVKLLPTGNNARTQGDKFGSAVALSGGYALVGSPEHNFDASGANTLNDAGAAFVFGASQGGNDNWGLVRKISVSGTGNREANDKFGYSVALSSGTAWIGAPFHAGSPKVSGAGAAIVFQGPVVSIWTGGQWVNGAPTSTRDAIIEADYNTQTNGNISCRNLTINSGVTLDIHTQGSVIVAAIASNQGRILNCLGGNFSAQSVSGNPVGTPAARPTAPASNLVLTYLGNKRLEIKWTAGNGSSRMVVLREGTAVGTSTAQDTKVYTANADFLGNGSELEGGKVVYVGNGNSVIVTNLGTATYAATVFEFNQNATCGPIYSQGTASSPVLGIEEDLHNLHVYPNPTTGVLYVEVREPSQIQIFRLDGALLRSYQVQHTATLELSDLPKGMYLLSNQSLTNKTTTKIAIE